LLSDYLPVNALLRLAFSPVADPAFYNPMLVLLGGIALMDIARRIFPSDIAAQIVVLLIYVTSTQMLVTAMTTYAMTGHMSLNLYGWRCFCEAVALARRSACTGLARGRAASVRFSPAFRRPFPAVEAAPGRLAPGPGLCRGLRAILAGWIAYPMIAALQTGAGAIGGAATDNALAEKAIPLLLNRQPLTLPHMTLNLMRFIAWQNLALLPLLAAALPFVWRDKGVGGPLLLGIAALIVFVTIILPYQGMAGVIAICTHSLAALRCLPAWVTDNWQRRAERKPMAWCWR
jgi:hypothetical protein